MRSQDFNRARRVSDQIAREVAGVLLNEVADPRVRGVTVSGVELSSDMRAAVVFVNCPLDSDSTQVMAGLAKAAPFIRHRLAEQVRMKYLPQIRFEHDQTLNQVDRIERLLKDARDGEH